MSFRIVAAFILILAGIRNSTIAARVPTSDDSVKVIEMAGVQELIRQHRGEVLVINVWATWCVPCVEEIPDLTTLSKESHVRVVGISIDDPEDVTSKVIPFLKRHAVPYPVFVKAAGNDEAFINALNKEWTGAVPVTFVYDSAGKQRTMLVGKQSYAAFHKAVESLRAR
jgi:thiol-disulfide isomerase/thioredoxin